MPAIASVAGENLVPAITGQGDGNVFACRSADTEGRHRRTVAERLVVDRRQSVEKIERIWIDGSDVMIGPVALGNLARKSGFVPPLRAKRDRECADRLGLQAGHHRDNAARIGATGEESAERNVGDHPHANRFAQAGDQLFFDLTRTYRRAVEKPQVPVRAGFGRRFAAPNQKIMRWRKLADAAVDRTRIGYIAKGEELLDRLRIEFPIDLRAQQQRFQLGSKEQTAIREKAVVERLLAEPVARQEQDLFRGIPQCEGEHAVKAVETCRTPFLPSVDDHLSVAARTEDMA